MFVGSFPCVCACLSDYGFVHLCVGVCVCRYVSLLVCLLFCVFASPCVCVCVSGCSCVMFIGVNVCILSTLFVS